MIDIEKIVERAYELFKPYKLIGQLDICTACCVSEEEKAILLQKPIKQIDLQTLISYTDSSKSGTDNNQEVLHFLPRYFELIAHFQYPTEIAKEQCLKILQDLDISQCSAEELEIIVQFGCAFFDKYLSQYEPSISEDIATVITMLDNATRFDMKAILALWLQYDSFTSMQHLRDLYYYKFHPRNNKLTNPFASKNLSKFLYDWLHTNEVVIQFKGQLEVKLMQDKENESVEKKVMNDLFEFYEYLVIVTNDKL